MLAKTALFWGADHEAGNGQALQRSFTNCIRRPTAGKRGILARETGGFPRSGAVSRETLLPLGWAMKHARVGRDFRRIGSPAAIFGRPIF